MINKTKNMQTLLYIGFGQRHVTQKEIRNAQKALLRGQIGDNDRYLIDAIISHFACGRLTEWTLGRTFYHKKAKKTK